MLLEKHMTLTLVTLSGGQFLGDALALALALAHATARRGIDLRIGIRGPSRKDAFERS